MIKRLAIFFFLLALMLNLQAQTKQYKQKKEAVRQQVIDCNTETDSRTKSICFENLADTYANNSQHKIAADYYEKALNETPVNKKQLTKKTAESYYKSANYPKAETYFNQLKKLAEQQKDQANIIFAEERLADIYLQQKQIEKARSSYKHVEEIERSQKNTYGVSRSMGNISNTYLIENDTLNAKKYLEKAEKIALEQSTKTQRMDDSFGDAEYLEEEIEVEPQQTHSWDIKEEPTIEKKQLETKAPAPNKKASSQEEFKALDILGDVNNKLGRKDKALELREKSLAKIDKSVSTKEILKLKQDLAINYRENGEEDKAIQQLEDVVQIADSSQILPDEKLEVLSKLNQMYSNSNSSINAKKLSRLANSLANATDSAFAFREYRESLSEVALTTEQQLSLLKQQEELDKAQINYLESEKSAQKTIIVLLLLALLIASVGGYLLYKNANEKKKANQILALKSLRSQMNPHFIFNALNSVNNFISKNDERAANKFLADFARLMRLVLDYSQEDFIPLEKEIAILQLYTKLEHFRFRDRFDYTFEVDEEITSDSFPIPPMLIQPYIENAVWHGLRYKETIGTLKISIQNKNSNLLVIIDDDGIGRTKSAELKTSNQKTHNSKGMSNIDSRLSIINSIYKTKIDVQVIDKLEGGTRVEIQIPFEKNRLKDA